jgi:serine/threonine protein kinase
LQPFLPLRCACTAAQTLLPFGQLTGNSSGRLLPLPLLQLMTQSRLSTASDVYSFAIIMHEMLTWQLPFHDLSKEQVCCLRVAVHDWCNDDSSTAPKQKKEHMQQQAVPWCAAVEHVVVGFCYSRNHPAAATTETHTHRDKQRCCSLSK